ncbi:MAG: sensor histidine kinase [Gammaproteobacteria bacterium]
MKTPRVLRSSTFRLSALYVALFSASTAILLGFIRYSTVGMMDRDTRERIDVDYWVLTETYRHAGINGLRRIVEERSGDRAVAGALYLLVDSYRRPLAGNLAFWPDDSGVEEGWIRLAIQMPGASGYIHHQATARLARLPNHYRLLVGRDIQDRLVFQELITQSLLLSVVIVGVLSLIGGVIISQRMLRRVDELARTANTIIQGDLGTRLPVQGIGDEFDRVAHNVNRMLDQIEGLTSGMRTVIDSVAHDLRGPLTRIRGHIELALAGPTDAVAYRQALDTALSESERLHRTVDALLHIAQAESGTIGMEMEPIDLAVVARDVLDLYQPFAEDKALRIENDIATGHLIRGNRQLLAQGLANLIDNAIKYTPEGGRIGLRVSFSGGKTRFEVRDSGPGIPEGDRARVLERFVRLDSSRTTPGTGLGLSLVAAVAKLHGASLTLGDNHPGLCVVLAFEQATGAEG